MGEPGGLQRAEAVLGGDGAAVLAQVVVDDLVDGMVGMRPNGGDGDLQVDVAVAEMAVPDDPRIRPALAERCLDGPGAGAVAAGTGSC